MSANALTWKDGEMADELYPGPLLYEFYLNCARLLVNNQEKAFSFIQTRLKRWKLDQKITLKPLKIHDIFWGAQASVNGAHACVLAEDSASEPGNFRNVLYELYILFVPAVQENPHTSSLVASLYNDAWGAIFTACPARELIWFPPLDGESQVEHRTALENCPGYQKTVAARRLTRSQIDDTGYERSRIHSALYISLEGVQQGLRGY